MTDTENEKYVYDMTIVEDYAELCIFVKNRCNQYGIEIISVLPDTHGVHNTPYHQGVSKGYIVIFREKAKRENGCSFCCCYEEDGNLYPKDGYTFYAGYNKQHDVDEFEEFESEEIKICPMCGRELVQK